MSIRDDIEKVNEKIEVLEKESLAMELLKDYKKFNKRMFIIILVILTFWFTTIGYLVYVLNDIGYIEETTTTQEVTQDNENGNNNFIGNDGDIIDGETEN